MTSIGTSGGLTLSAAKLLFSSTAGRGFEHFGIKAPKSVGSVLPPGVAPPESMDPSKLTPDERTSVGRAEAMRGAMDKGNNLGVFSGMLNAMLADPEKNSLEEAQKSGSEERVLAAYIRQGMINTATAHLTSILGHPPVLEDTPEGGQRMASFTYEEKFSYGDGKYIDFAVSGGGGEKVRYALLDSQTSLHWTYQYDGGGSDPKGTLLHTNA